MPNAVVEPVCAIKPYWMVVQYRTYNKEAECLLLHADSEESLQEHLVAVMDEHQAVDLLGDYFFSVPRDPRVNTIKRFDV